MRRNSEAEATTKQMKLKSLYLAAALLLCSSCYKDPARVTTPMAPTPPSITQKLDPPLRALVEAARSKDPNSAIPQTVKAQNIPVEQGLIAVKITADKIDSIPALEKLVTANGGKVTVHLDVALFAQIPPAAIEKIAADSSVWNITVPAMSAFPQNH